MTPHLDALPFATPTSLTRSIETWLSWPRGGFIDLSEEGKLARIIAHKDGVALHIDGQRPETLSGPPSTVARHIRKRLKNSGFTWVFLTGSIPCA